MSATAQRATFFNPVRFLNHYKQWLDDCLEEFNTRHWDEVLGRARYHDMNCPPMHASQRRGFHPAQRVEFREDGTALRFGTRYPEVIPHAVTPWKESVHYCAG